MHKINIKHTHTYIIQIYDKKRDTTHKHSLFTLRDKETEIDK